MLLWPIPVDLFDFCVDLPFHITQPLFFNKIEDGELYEVVFYLSNKGSTTTL